MANKNSKTAKGANASKAFALTAARKTNLANVRKAAFASGAARSTVIAATFAACGKSPVLALYNATKVELQIGFMAAALARKGDNREPDALMEHCRDRLANFAGFGGTGKLKNGQKGRRTKVEEDAYGSARVLVSSIFKDAGVKVPEARGGDTSATRSPGGAAKGKAPGKAEAPAKAEKPTTPRCKDKGELVAYLLLQSKAMLATINRNAKVAPIEAKSAVQDFAAALAKLA